MVEATSLFLGKFQQPRGDIADQARAVPPTDCICGPLHMLLRREIAICELLEARHAQPRRHMKWLAREDGLVQGTRLIPAALLFKLPGTIPTFGNGLHRLKHNAAP